MNSDLQSAFRLDYSNHDDFISAVNHSTESRLQESSQTIKTVKPDDYSAKD